MHSPADHTDTFTAHLSSQSDTASWEHLDIGEESQCSNGTLVGEVELPAAAGIVAASPQSTSMGIPYGAHVARSPPGPPDLTEFHAWVPSPMAGRGPVGTEPALEVSGVFVPDVGAGTCIPMKIWLTFRELRQYGLSGHRVHILQGRGQQDTGSSSAWAPVDDPSHGGMDEVSDCMQSESESESEPADSGEDLGSMDCSDVQEGPPVSGTESQAEDSEGEREQAVLSSALL